MAKKTQASKPDKASRRSSAPHTPAAPSSPDWHTRIRHLWGGSLRDKSKLWLEAWIAFQAVAREGQPAAIDSAPEWMRAASTLMWCSLLTSGESQALAVRDLALNLEALPHGFSAYLRCDPMDLREKSRSLVKERKAWPDEVMKAGRLAENDVRRVLSQDHLLPRLRVRSTSLLARLAVTVFRNGGVLMKQKAHLLHTGLDKKPAKQLEKLMTPRGQWATTGLGTVDGDYLRLSNSGRDQAERLVDLGVVALGGQGTASGN